MRESIDERLEPVDLVGQVMDGVEFVSPCAVAAFDGAVELWPFGRQDEEVESLALAGLFEFGHEVGPAVDLDAVDLERHVGDDAVEEGGGGVRLRGPPGPRRSIWRGRRR